MSTKSSGLNQGCDLDVSRKFLTFIGYAVGVFAPELLRERI